MSGKDAGARLLNRLPDSHWKRWYAEERAMNRAIDRHLAAGLSPIDAYDAALKECGYPK